MRFGRFVWVGDGTKIRCHEGEVTIGAKTVLGQECTISAYQHVRIGEQCVVADRAMFIDFDHGVVDVERPIRRQGIYMRDVEVGSNVWIGYGACILRGVAGRRQLGDRHQLRGHQGRSRQRGRRRRPGEDPPDARGAGDAALARPGRARPRAGADERAARLGRAQRAAGELGVDSGGALGDVGPVEAPHVLGGLGDEAAPSSASDSTRYRDLAERPRVAGPEPQPGLLVGHDLAQAAGVGDDAGAARRHRLERDEAERLVDRGDDADVGDPVERVQDVVADPAEEGAVLHQPELGRLALAAPARGCPSRRPESGSRGRPRSAAASPRARAESPSRRRAGRSAERASRRAPRTRPADGSSSRPVLGL